MKYYDDLCLKCLRNEKISRSVAIGWIDCWAIFYIKPTPFFFIDLFSLSEWKIFSIVNPANPGTQSTISANNLLTTMR